MHYSTRGFLEAARDGAIRGVEIQTKLPEGIADPLITEHDQGPVLEKSPRARRESM